MTVRFYQINGTWYSWDDVHNAMGYTDHATTSTSYKTTSNWGTVSGSTGYCDTAGVSDFWQYLYFVPGVVGWNDINDLALEGYYPATATDLLVYKDGTASNAASITVDDTPYYLVQGDLDQGWMTETELLERGWVFLVPNYGFIIVNETTGEIESGEQLEELLLSPVGTLVMSDAQMLLIPESAYETTPLYFTANGEAETNNTTLKLENALYFADGTRVRNSDVSALATKPFAFMDKDNQFFMGTNSDELFEMTAVNAGLRCLGSGSSIGKAALLALFEPKTEEVTAYFRTEGSAYEYDTQINQGGGNNLYNASGSNLYYDSSRIYTVVALYNASNELQPCGNGDSIKDNSGYLYYSRGTTLSRVFAHHIVFKQTIPPPPSVLSAYFTNQGAAATSDSSLPSIATMYTAEGVALHKEADKTYTIVDLLDYNGASVQHNSADFITSSGGYLIFYTNQTVTAYKITYTVS